MKKRARWPAMSLVWISNYFAATALTLAFKRAL